MISDLRLFTFLLKALLWFPASRHRETGGILPPVAAQS